MVKSPINCASAAPAGTVNVFAVSEYCFVREHFNRYFSMVTIESDPVHLIHGDPLWSLHYKELGVHHLPCRTTFYHILLNRHLLYAA